MGIWLVHSSHLNLRQQPTISGNKDGQHRPNTTTLPDFWQVCRPDTALAFLVGTDYA
jgi:hypothetical protein